MTLFAISLGALEAFVLRLSQESLAELDPHSQSEREEFPGGGDIK